MTCDLAGGQTGAGAQGGGPAGAIADFARAQETFACPVFPSRRALQHRAAGATSTTGAQPLLHIDMRHEGVAALRWALRGVTATLRPY